MAHIWQMLQSGRASPADGLRRAPAIATRSAYANHRLQFADAAVWSVIGAGAIVIIGASLLTMIHIERRSFVAPGSVAALLAAAGWWYRTRRGDARLGAILNSTAQIVGFAAVAAPLSYIAATAGFPLWDATLDAWDHHLNFDWTQATNFIAARPGLRDVLFLAYSSFALQTITTVLALGIAGQLDRLGAFIAAFVCTTLITIAGSAFYPAAGPYLFLGLHPEITNGFLPVSSTSWPVFLGLRDGTMHTVYGLNSEGIITFPSLHAALGFLFAAALWRVRVVRWIALGLNGAMLIATPAYGSHYVVDVIAGVAIAMACWFAAISFIAANSRATRAQLATLAGTPSIVPEAVSGSESAQSRNLESV
jgi:membrane-associated phospholipid phosphatase